MLPFRWDTHTSTLQAYRWALLVLTFERMHRAQPTRKGSRQARQCWRWLGCFPAPFLHTRIGQSEAWGRGEVPSLPRTSTGRSEHARAPDTPAAEPCGELGGAFDERNDVGGTRRTPAPRLLMSTMSSELNMALSRVKRARVHCSNSARAGRDAHNNINKVIA